LPEDPQATLSPPPTQFNALPFNPISPMPPRLLALATSCVAHSNTKHEIYLRAAPPHAAPSDHHSFFWLGGKMLSTLYRSDVPPRSGLNNP